jgi:hypothetical protein
MSAALGRSALGLFLGAATLLSCKGTASKATGSEGGPCYRNETCDMGLTCLSSLCVNASPADASAGTSGGAGHGAGSGTAGSGGGGGGAAGSGEGGSGVSGASGGAGPGGAGGAAGTGMGGAGVGGPSGGAPGLAGKGADGGVAGTTGDASMDDSGGDASAALSLPAVAPSHLQLWLTADRGLRCASGEVTTWLDQSGKGRDATRGVHTGPECPQTLHALGGVNLPYFSAPGVSPPFNDETLDVDLGFLTDTDYTIFVVERRWADRSPTSGENEFLIGTDVPAQASGCPSSGYQITFGYVFYDGVPALGYESICYSPFSGTRGAAPVTPLSPPGPAAYDMLRLAQTFAASPAVWQNGVKINAGGASGGPGMGFVGGSIGRSFGYETSDNRFQGDIAEVVVFDTALTDDEAKQMGDYFKQHWHL